MKTHNLKIDKEMYDRVRSGEKTFEVRKDHRHYQTGDNVVLDPNYQNTGCFPGAAPPPVLGEPNRPPLMFKIGFVLRGGQYGLEPGYVVFSLFPEMPDCTDPGNSWIEHAGLDLTPAFAATHSLIEVVSRGNTREHSMLIHPSNVKWNNIKEWRPVK